MRCLVRVWQAHEAELLGFLRNRYREGGGRPPAGSLSQGHEPWFMAFCHLDNLRAWLFQVARNLVVDRLRTAKPDVP